jgi:hypothetical protein
MRAGRRVLFPVLAGFSLLGAGCGGSGPATPDSAAARDHLAATVLRVVDDDGIPVDGDRIHCSGSLKGRSDTCDGYTSNEPVEKITGTFTESAAGFGPGCPGGLTVTLGPPPGYLDGSGPVKLLTERAVDPCQ